MSQQQQQPPAAGRGAPQIQARPGFRFTQGQQTVLWLLGAGAVVTLVFWQQPPGGDPPMPEDRQVEIRRVASATEGTQPRREEPTTPPSPPSGTPSPPQQQTGAPPMPPATGSWVGGGAGAGAAGAGEKPRRMLSFATTTPPPAAPGTTQQTGDGAGVPSSPSPPGQPGQQGPTTVAFGGTSLPGRRAGAAIDTSLVLMPGIYSCVLETAVDSERPGPFFCRVREPIRSPADVTLMERGTRIVGTYSNEVGQGQGRIASLAATAWTPQGVPVPLGAQVGDPLGRTGMAGQVDTHFWPRMQTAVVLLLTRGALQTAQTALQSALSKSNTTNLNISSGGVEQAIAESLRGTQGIQNTVRVNQGEEISFMVTEPVSFADAYRLAPR